MVAKSRCTKRAVFSVVALRVFRSHIFFVDNKGRIQRTAAQLRNHYEVERELAQRLLNSNRDERKLLFSSLYDELFERVPDHPRLTRRDTPERSEAAVEARLRILEPHLSRGMHFLEFAAGDCRLAHEVCRLVDRVTAVDISDQRAIIDKSPENFNLELYDGYALDVRDSSVDVVFSYQFLEHLHPEDIEVHFDNVVRILKKGGMYIFDTPHRFSGPHDISGNFGSSLDCLHFQEWTYREMFGLLRRHGFACCYAYAGGKVRRSKLTNLLKIFAENFVGVLPSPLRKLCSARLFQGVTAMAIKG